MEGFDALWIMLSGGLIMPTAQWIKGKIPQDLPISTLIISATLSFGAVYGLAYFFVPDMTTQMMLTYAMGSNLVAQTVHATIKTKKKNSLPKAA